MRHVRTLAAVAQGCCICLCSLGTGCSKSAELPSDFIPFWTGTGEQYHELYEKIARAIRTWGDVTVKQYRIDARSNLTVVQTHTVSVADRTQGLKVSGKWARATASTNAPKGAAQGADLIAVTGASASQPSK